MVHFATNTFTRNFAGLCKAMSLTCTQSMSGNWSIRGRVRARSAHRRAWWRSGGTASGGSPSASCRGLVASLRSQCPGPGSLKDAIVNTRDRWCTVRHCSLLHHTRTLLRWPLTWPHWANIETRDFYVVLRWYERKCQRFIMNFSAGKSYRRLKDTFLIWSEIITSL